MKRYAVILMVIGLVLGLLGSTADARKKKKPKPVPVDQVFYIVWDGEGCALATTTDMASEEDACADPFAGAFGAQLGSGPWAMPALDGIPVTLDASKPITGKISAESYYLFGPPAQGDVMGIGQAELSVKLVGVSGGEEIVIGELTTDPYLVTPASAEYVVEFEIDPADELQNKVFESLTLHLELTGDQMFHGVLPADGTSTLTVGAYETK